MRLVRCGDGPVRQPRNGRSVMQIAELGELPPRHTCFSRPALLHCPPAWLPPLHCPPPPSHFALQEFYSLTLDSMAEAKNERLWFKTNMKLANLWVSLKEAGKAAKVSRAGGSFFFCG